MKVKVMSEFIDRHTGKLHRTGEVFSCDEKRYKEIMKVDASLVCELPTEDENTVTEPVETPVAPAEAEQKVTRTRKRKGTRKDNA